MSELETLSEKIERDAFISMFDNCPEDTRKELGLELHEVGDALVAVARNDPSILINRVVGLGTKTPATPETVERIAQIYRDIGVTSYFLHLYAEDASDEVLKAIGNQGLIPARGWMKFQRDASPSREAKTDLIIRRVGPEDAASFGRIAAAAFDMTEAAAPMVAGLVNDPKWHLYLSYDGDTPAGTGGIYISDDIALTEFGATDPAFRCRGSQGAIMAERINVAHKAGCKLIFTETGEAVEGDPQHSYNNIERYGFKPVRVRQNFKPG